MVLKLLRIEGKTNTEFKSINLLAAFVK